MPIHKYKCVGCGNTDEYLHKMNKDPSSCSNCGSTSGLMKLIGLPNAGGSKKKGTEYIENCLIVHPTSGKLVEAHTIREVRDDSTPGEVVSDFVLKNGKKITNLRTRKYNLTLPQ